MSIVNIEALKQNNCILHWTGTVASANSPKQITSYGDCKQILPFPGAGIGMFDGTGDYLTVSHDSGFNFGTGNFTIEFWLSIPVLPAANQCVFSKHNNVDLYQWASCSINIATSSVRFYTTSNGTSWDIGYIDVPVPSFGVNHHYALVRNGTTFTAYINGVAIASTLTSSNAIYSNSELLALCAYSNGNYAAKCNLSELRISSVARYTANFTPPRRQLESDSNTKLLIHFNRNDSTFIDSSPSAHTITAYGDAKQLCSPCGSGVAYFDGNGDYLTCGTVADWSYLHKSNAKYSINFSFMCTSLTNSDFNVILDTASSSSNSGILVGIVGATGTIRFAIAKAVSQNYYIICESTATIVENTWYNVVITYDDTLAADNAKLYVNGTLWKTATKSGTPSSSDCYAAINIGRYASNERYFKGYISEVRVINSVVSPLSPTQPFTPDPYTKLLLHMDGVGNAFYDSSDPPGDNGFPILPDGVTITPNGTFTTQKMKDGRNVWVFDGSTNYITISDHASWSMFLNDFTIAAWVKFDSIAANRTIIGQYTDTNNQWFVRWTTSNVIQLYGITSSTARFDFTCPLTPVAGTWYHIVVQRSGSSCVMYINGVAQTVTQTTAFSATATDIAAVLSIGKINTEYQAGNIKNLQIFTKALTMDQISALYQETYIY